MIPIGAALTKGRVDFRKIIHSQVRGLIVRKARPDERQEKFSWYIEFHSDGKFLGGTIINLTHRPTVMSVLRSFLLEGLVPGQPQETEATIQDPVQDVVALDEELHEQLKTRMESSTSQVKLPGQESTDAVVTIAQITEAARIKNEGA